jgi:hypothetical protein
MLICERDGNVTLRNLVFMMVVVRVQGIVVSGADAKRRTGQKVAEGDNWIIWVVWWEFVKRTRFFIPIWSVGWPKFRNRI